MELQHLKYFFHVATIGSVSGAASEMHLSAPAVSKMLRTLEDSLGQRLFVRSFQRLILTPQGERLLEECRPIFDKLKSIERQFLQYQTELTGILRLGASDNLCHYRLPRILRSFLRAHPQVKVNLYAGTATEICQKVKGGQLDLGMFYTLVREASIRLSEWDVVPFTVACSPDHPLARERHASPARLSQFSFIGSRTRDYGGVYPVKSMLKTIGIDSPVILECNSQETQKKVVLQGIGYSIFPLHMVEEDLKMGKLVAVITTKRLTQPVYIAKRRFEELDPVTESFRRHLIEFKNLSHQEEP